MQLCSNCGHQNRAGVVFCENCGASLIGKMPLDTKSLDSSSEEEKVQIGIDVSVLTDVKVQGLVAFHDGDTLRLDIDGSPEPIKFKPKPETIFGRRDPATGAMPDVDLTPFAGYRMGVSRRHAAIRFGDDNNLDIWDLGSSNGTFLNGQRLSAHRPYRLRDGDELRLGQMMVRIYFDVAPKPAETPATVEPAPSAVPAAGEAVPQPPAKPAPSAVPAAGEAVSQPPVEPAPSAVPAAGEAVPQSPVEPAPSAAPAAGEAVSQPPAKPAPSAAPAAGEVAPQQPASQPEKAPSGSTIAIQPSAIEAASVAPSSPTLPPSQSPPITAPLSFPKPEAAPDKPDFPAGQTNSAALSKPDEPKEAPAPSTGEVKPPESPKPPENEEKRD